jgi:hypothetical protein
MTYLSGTLVSNPKYCIPCLEAQILERKQLQNGNLLDEVPE